MTFAKALCDGDFAGARGLLAATLKADFTEADLQREFDEMTDYGDGPPDTVEVMNFLDDWPQKKPGDLGWAYVAISGPGFGEAVAVIVTGERLIREIEWGRP
ncbi:hypothetical protein H2509_01205 [Stappia sp. F7233]|uniref:Uncharacterized protein n=1 Tax=Stappia albiluteola TaxID=2758565 RepID=A0A839A9X8_9HYPH|nr:hypothetical protein [Stappia albiluteola]